MQPFDTVIASRWKGGGGRESSIVLRLIAPRAAVFTRLMDDLSFF